MDVFDEKDAVFAFEGEGAQRIVISLVRRPHLRMALACSTFSQLRLFSRLKPSKSGPFPLLTCADHPVEIQYLCLCFTTDQLLSIPKATSTQMCRGRVRSWDAVRRLGGGCERSRDRP